MRSTELDIVVTIQARQRFNSFNFTGIDLRLITVNSNDVDCVVYEDGSMTVDDIYYLPKVVKLNYVAENVSKNKFSGVIVVVHSNNYVIHVQ